MTHMDRWEKIEWLKETTSQDFQENNLLDEMVSWMGESDFNKFYDHLCSCWNIARTPTEMDAIMEGKHDQYDADSDSIMQGSEENEEEEGVYAER